jgi:tetraacyldisaccharide-1-P 4'-kinase
MMNLISLADGRIVGLGEFAGKKVAALSGIARPGRFVSDLERLGMEIALRCDFDDHHRYRPEELSSAIERARAARAEAIITTEKDAANIPVGALNSSAMPVFAAHIEFGCEKESELKDLTLRAIRRRLGDRSGTLTRNNQH